MYFCVYQRWVLGLVSMYTWANLNHTLCDADNDPVFAYFNLGESYWFWAEFYLGIAAFAGVFVNLCICYLFKTASELVGCKSNP